MRLPLLLMALLLVPGCTRVEKLFAPPVELWPRWQANDPASTASLDHRAWDRFLAAYLVAGADGVNRVDYGRVGEADKEVLAQYVAQLAAVPVSRLNRREQFAYWVNLYNALTVRVVLDHYPVGSIRDINLSPGAVWGPWAAKLVSIEGEGVSLDDIEHRILRPIWRDARVHYALNCAAVGCPNLQPRAFTAADTEALLTAGGKSFVNHPRGVTMIGDEARVSSLYGWFEEDFGGSEKQVIAHLRRFAVPELGARLAHSSGIAGYRYDWTLNDAGLAPRPVEPETDAPERE